MWLSGVITHTRAVSCAHACRSSCKDLCSSGGGTVARCASSSIPIRRSRRSRAPPSPTSTSSWSPATARASPRSPPCRTAIRPGILVLPDVRGLYGFYEELALRFAELGHPALAIDYFGRTAGADRRGDDLEFAEHVAATTPEGIRDDVAAAVAALRDRGAPSVLAVGFCFGGRQAWLAAADGHGLAGAVGFYANPGERNGAPGPTQRAADLEAPILALQAGADQNITAEMNEAFEQALTDAGVEHELVTYEGAPHSFFDRRYEEFDEASEDAWRRVLEFLETHSA